jgi:hypothetical protein
MADGLDTGPAGAFPVPDFSPAHRRRHPPSPDNSMNNANRFLSSIVGDWTGSGAFFDTPWTQGYPVTVFLAVSNLWDSKAFEVRVKYIHDGTPSFESLTLISTEPDPGFWTLDSMGVLPDTPGSVTAEDGTLTLKRQSPKGSNLTAYQPGPRGLSLKVDFAPAGGGAVLAVAASELTRTDQGTHGR